MSGGTSGTSTGGSSTAATATHSSGSAPTATPQPAPPHAFAWYQRDSSNTAQIWASINGAAPRQITHIAPTPPPDTCVTNENAWSPPVFSPDLTHIIAAEGNPQCGGGSIAQGAPYIITAATGALTRAPGPNVSGPYGFTVPSDTRGAGWLDNSTVWFSTFDTFYTYHLGDAHSVELPGFSTIGQYNGLDDAVVRGSTLFFELTTSSSTNVTFSLRRYDLSSHSMISGAISLGAAGTSYFTGQPGQAISPGWDVSADGSHLVYQVVTQSGGGIGGTKVYYASADGSGATRIATALFTSHLMCMQFSPNGQWVAFTTALPSPATLTATVSSAGGSGDPTFQGYSPDTTDYPVWKWDSSEFWAQASGGLYHFIRGGSSGMGVAGGLNPWYTIGS
ncbi:MAG TPA: hypothetical protein VFN78_11605 [Ktedonobacterales bacterium]|nr:hypothetical protein [Ktedonobacterales bacterium]